MNNLSDQVRRDDYRVDADKVALAIIQRLLEGRVLRTDGPNQG